MTQEYRALDYEIGQNAQASPDLHDYKAAADERGRKRRGERPARERRRASSKTIYRKVPRSVSGQRVALTFDGRGRLVCAALLTPIPHERRTDEKLLALNDSLIARVLS